MKVEPTGDELLKRLLHGESGGADMAALAAHASGNEGLAKRIADELAFSEMLRQAIGPVVDEVIRFEVSLSSSSLLIDDLMGRVGDGSATRFECDQVVKHLWEFPEMARQLRRDLVMEELFREALSPSKSADAFLESLETRMWAETRRDHFVDDFAKRLELELVPRSPEETAGGKIVPFPGNWGRVAVQMGAVAAALALGAFVAAQMAADHLAGKPSLASVVKTSAGVVWSAGASPGKDGSIKSGLYHLTSGVVSMRMSSGSELTVEGPAVFEVGDDASTFVHEGIALARVSSNDPGISLRSRGLSVAEPARLIGIDARIEGATEAIVFNGDGGICLTGGGKCRELSEFEAVKADHLRDKLVDVPYNPHAFSKAWALLSGVENNLGSVRIEMPGAEIASSRGEEGEVQVFVENESFRPEAELEVDQVVVGEFKVAEANPGQQLQAKGELRSYLLQLWPSAGSGDGEVETSLTFDHPVVGVIFSSDRLDNSDSSVGSAMVQIDGAESVSRGMDSGSDEILLSQDRRTLNFRIKGGGNQMEQVRVLVALN